MYEIKLKISAAFVCEIFCQRNQQFYLVLQIPLLEECSVNIWCIF